MVDEFVKVVFHHPDFTEPFELSVPDEQRFNYLKPILSNCSKHLDNYLRQNLQLATFVSANIYIDILEYLNTQLDSLLKQVANDQGLPDLKWCNLDKFDEVINERANILIQATITALKRVNKHIQAVCQISLNKKDIQYRNCKLIKITYTNSDTHHAGQSVLILTIQENGVSGRIVYKPASVLIDLLISGNTKTLDEYGLTAQVCQTFKVKDLPKSFFEILHDEQVNRQIKPVVALPTYIIFPCSDSNLLTNVSEQYGFIQYLSHGAPQDNLVEYRSRAILDRYSEQCGMAAIVALMLNMNDWHCENLIISRLSVFAIDLENSLMPKSPNAKSTLLFNKNISGFYANSAEREENYNHLYYRPATSKLQQLYFINLPFYKQGINKIMQIMTEDKINHITTWINHPIFKVVPLRVVPYATRILAVQQISIQQTRLMGKEKNEISQNTFDTLTTELETDRHGIDSLKKDPMYTITNNGIRVAALLGDENYNNFFNCLWTGDFPAYHAIASSTHLLDPEDKRLQLNSDSRPINCFLHTPVQAQINRFFILKISENYQKFIQLYLEINLIFINSYFQNKPIAQELENHCEVYNKAATQLYQMLDYSYLCSKNVGISNTLKDVINSLFEVTLNALSTSLKTLPKKLPNNSNHLINAIKEVLQYSSELMDKIWYDYVRQVQKSQENTITYGESLFSHETFHEDISHIFSTLVQAPLYSEADIHTVVIAQLDAIGIKYLPNYTYLLNRCFIDTDNREYFVAITPAIDTAGKAHIQYSSNNNLGISSINFTYYLDKSTWEKDVQEEVIEKLLGQLPAEENNINIDLDKIVTSMESTDNRLEVIKGLLQESNNNSAIFRQKLQNKLNEINSTKKDAFDEVMPTIINNNQDPCFVKIIFPYNITNHHWLAGEIIIQKQENQYTVQIYIHDPCGGGSLSSDHLELLQNTIQKRLQEKTQEHGLTAEIHFEKHEQSPYPRRQAPNDAVSCGVITSEDVFARILGLPLDKQYEPGALSTRKSHNTCVKNYFDKHQMTTSNFLKRNALSNTNILPADTSNLFLEEKPEEKTIQELINFINQLKNTDLKERIIAAITITNAKAKSYQEESMLYVMGIKTALEQMPILLANEGISLDKDDIAIINNLTFCFFSKDGICKGSHLAFMQLAAAITPRTSNQLTTVDTISNSNVPMSAQESKTLDQFFSTSSTAERLASVSIKERKTSKPLTTEINKSIQHIERKGLKISSDPLNALLKLPENLTVGTAVADGGCGFDALAQCLGNGYTEELLRKVCHEYYEKLSGEDNCKEVDKWINALGINNPNMGDPYLLVQYTGEFLKQQTAMKDNPTWFVQEIDGRVLCHALPDILPNGIHVIEVATDPEGVGHYVITKEGYKQIAEDDKIQNLYQLPTLIVLGKHFVPVLPKENVLTLENQPVKAEQERDTKPMIIRQAKDQPPKQEDTDKLSSNRPKNSFP